MLTAIRNWVIRTMMKSKGETGIVKTLPKKEIVDINTQITAERLMQNGVDPRSLKNADQVENAIIAIENRSNVQTGITSTKSADVFDLKGKKIKDTDNIMGGEELPPGDPDLPPPGSRGGDDDIAAPVQSAEETIKNMIEAENKKNISKMKNRKMVDDAIDNMSPSLSGDTRTDAALVAEDMAESMGKVYDDLSSKERLDLYDQAYTALSKQRYKGMKKPKDDPDEMAQGGRAGFKFGMGPLKTLFDFANKKSPLKAYTDYLKSVKERMKAGKEAEVAGEVIPIAAGGALLTNQLKKKLKKMNEEQKKRIEEEAQEELRKDMNKADGGRIGYFMGGPNPKGLGTLRAILNYMSKTGKEQGKFKGADLSALDMLRLSNPKALNRLLEDVRGKVNVREGIMGTDTVRAQQQALREKRKGITAAALEVAKDMKAKDIKIKRRIAEEAEYTIIPQMKKQLMEGMGMSEETAEKTARGMAEAAQNIRLINDPPIITKEGLLQLENVLKNLETGGKKKRELNATGGRIGFKDGMTRRTFLKLLGGVMSIPIIGKVIAPLKLAKGVTKVPIIKTDNVPGKPEWFDALVNKVIIEGEDVTKKFATAERQSIHQKTLDDGSVVRVTEDVDDGAVRVEYESDANMFEDPVQLQYKKPLPDEGDPRPVGEFTTAESGIVGRADGPDDYTMDVEEVGGKSISDLDSDVSKLKEYATGKKLTIKELSDSMKRKKNVKYYQTDEGQVDYVTTKQGDYDPGPEEFMSDDYDFASGGIARMLGE